MSKYLIDLEIKINLIRRMYQDHGYSIDDICLRLRYPKEMVTYIIEKNNLKHGEKSWRY